MSAVAIKAPTLADLAKDLRDLMSADETDRTRNVAESQRRAREIGARLAEGRAQHASDNAFSDWIKGEGLAIGMWAAGRERRAAMAVAGAPATEFNGCNNSRPHDMMKWLRKKNGATMAATSGVPSATPPKRRKPVIKIITGGKDTVKNLKAVADQLSEVEAKILVTHLIERFLTAKDYSFFQGPMLLTRHVFSLDRHRDLQGYDAVSPVDFDEEIAAQLKAQDPFMLTMKEWRKK